MNGENDPMGGLEPHHPQQPFTPSPDMPNLPATQPAGITNAMWESLVHRIASLEHTLQSLSQNHSNLVHSHETLMNRHQELSASRDILTRDANEAKETLTLNSSSFNRTLEPKIPDPSLYSGN